MTTPARTAEITGTERTEVAFITLFVHTPRDHSESAEALDTAQQIADQTAETVKVLHRLAANGWTIGYAGFFDPEMLEWWAKRAFGSLDEALRGALADGAEGCELWWPPAGGSSVYNPLGRNDPEVGWFDYWLNGGHLG